MNKPFICNCGVKKGKHRRDHWCDVWEATGPDDRVHEWDDCDAHHAKTDDMSKPEYDRYMGYTEDAR